MAEIIYELIRLEEFVIKTSATGQEYIAVGQNGTYRIKSSDLINAVATQQGFIKATALTPINNQVAGLNTSVSSLASQTASLKVDVDSKIPKTNVIDNLNTPSSSFVLSARQGKILNDRIADFSGQIGSGIIGEAFPATVPISEGFGIYTVSTVGTFVNFKDANGDPIEVTEDNLTAGIGGLVQLWGNDNVWEKHVTVIDDGTIAPETDEDLFL